MKNTLVALAALAVVGSAFAQSSLTLYGRIDAAIGSQKTTIGGVNRPAVAATGPAVVAADGSIGPTTKATDYGDIGTQLLAGSHTGNRWGMKGSEDLGGGLKANFQLENGFGVDTGAAAQGGLLFGRQAWVGLSGGFGALQVGRQYTVIDNMWTAHDAFALSGYSAANYAFNKGGYADSSRQNNSVYYTTPSFGGFKAGALWAPGENKAAGVSAGRMMGLEASYANGPFSIGGAYESNKVTGAAPATTAWELGTTYDLGVAKLFGQLEGSNTKSTNSKDDGYQIGVQIPLGAPSLWVSYARENNKLAGTKVSTASAYALMAQYPLSKRTYVYAAYMSGENNPIGVAATTKNRNFGLGLVHNF